MRAPGATSEAQENSRLGDNDRAIAYLEKAYEARSWYMAVVGVDAKFDRLRSDPRFAKLVAEVGLQQR